MSKVMTPEQVALALGMAGTIRRTEPLGPLDQARLLPRYRGRKKNGGPKGR